MIDRDNERPRNPALGGKFLGSQARPGQIYTMVGDLGVGKTVFTQGVRPGAWNPGSGKQSDLYDRPGI